MVTISESVETGFQGSAPFALQDPGPVPGHFGYQKQILLGI
mgnify:CR=1 FL=1